MIRRPSTREGGSIWRSARSPRCSNLLRLEDVNRDDFRPDELVAGLETRPKPAGDGFVAFGVVGGHGRYRALAAGVEVVTLVLERLDSLAIKRVLDRGANRLQRAAQGGRAIRLVCRLGLDHLADVVVKLDQVDEDRPLYLQQQVLLVLLELGVQSIDDPLAGCLGADLAIEKRLQAR